MDPATSLQKVTIESQRESGKWIKRHIGSSREGLGVW